MITTLGSIMQNNGGIGLGMITFILHKREKESMDLRKHLQRMMVKPV